MTVQELGLYERRGDQDQMSMFQARTSRKEIQERVQRPGRVGDDEVREGGERAGGRVHVPRVYAQGSQLGRAPREER